MAQKLSNLPIGAKIKFGSHQVASESKQSIIWVVADKNHTGYPSNSISLISQKIIDIMAYDAAENGTYSYGNPDYALSNINQWLNSAAASGGWYSATHSNDAPPSSGKVTQNPYQTRAGFLNNFTSYERLLLLPTTVSYLTNENTYTNTTAKVFLPTMHEILGNDASGNGGARLAYFETNSAATTLTNQVFTYSSEPNLPSSVNENWQYLTRSASSNKVRAITATGGTGTDYANFGNKGVRPVVNLPATAKISDGTDGDGCYTVIENNAPTISGSNTNLGTKYPPGFAHTYSVNDTDTSDTVTVTEYIDNVSIRSYVATKNATNTFDITGTTWLKLANGTHTLKITATDGWDTTTRTITFVKSVNTLEVELSTPMAASTRPSQIIVNVVKTIPYDAVMYVAVCNNGFDAQPQWETLETSSVSTGLAHEFKNTICTAGKWGVNIRVNVARGSGTGACYISEIGGNFE